MHRCTALVLAIVAIAALPLVQGALLATASSLSTTAHASADLDDSVVHWLTSEVPVNSAQLRLEAKRLELEVDSAPYVWAGLTAVGTTQPTTTAQAFTSATATGGNWYNQTSLFVVPAGALVTRLDSESQSTALPDANCALQPLFFPSGRQPLCPDLSESFTMRAHASRLTFNGSFDVYLWGWQGAIVDGNGSQPYWTGTQYPSAQVPGVPVGPGESRFAKMAVRDGNLVVELAKPSELYVHATAGTLTALEATLHGSAVAAARDAVVEMRRAGDAISLVVKEGTVTDLAGRTVAVGVEPQRGVWYPWLALLVVPGVGLAYFATRGRTHLRGAADNLVLGNHAAALRHAEAARFYPWSRRRGEVLAAISLLKAKRSDEAGVRIERIRVRHDAAAADFLTAYLEVSKGRVIEARNALMRAIAANDGYRAEAMTHDALRRLLPSAERGELS